MAEEPAVSTPFVKLLIWSSAPEAFDTLPKIYEAALNQCNIGASACTKEFGAVGVASSINLVKKII